MAVCTLGGIIAIPSGFFLAVSFGDYGQRGFPLGWALVWTIHGLAQWLVLCRRISGSGWWIVATAFGGSLALPILMVLNSTFSNWMSGSMTPLVLMPCIGAVDGAIVGLAQSLVLWATVPNVRGEWILSSTIGGLTVLPPTSAMITGITLVKLFQPKSPVQHSACGHEH
ncbi:hypothetical protein BST81_12790 [Leptolyngbya sp. 'hensonii']|nr:hypothetical protein BST81_12790 [Leptolyngbya sp. 'hensonii']